MRARERLQETPSLEGEGGCGLGSEERDGQGVDFSEHGAKGCSLERANKWEKGEKILGN